MVELVLVLVQPYQLPGTVLIDTVSSPVKYVDGLDCLIVWVGGVLAILHLSSGKPVLRSVSSQKSKKKLQVRKEDVLLQVIMSVGPYILMLYEASHLLFFE